MFLMLTAQVTSQNPAWRDPAAYNHFSSTHHPCLPAKTTVPSTDVPGGPALLHNLATISSQKNKRARLSAPEDDDDFLRGAVMVESVKAAIWNSLNHYAFEDALFAAERLYAESHTDESSFLLATCLYRSGDKHRAHEILSRCHPEQASPDIRYLYGKICCDLEQYERAESILTNSSVFAKPYCLEDLENFYKPDTISFALQLLGVIHQKSQRNVHSATLNGFPLEFPWYRIVEDLRSLIRKKELSAAAFKRAVSLNPFQWSTFENLCRMKETIDPKETFFRAIASKSSRSLDVHSDDDSQLDSPPSEDVDMVPAEEVVAKVSSVITSSPLPAKSVLVKKPIPKTADKSVVGATRPRMRSIVEESMATNPVLHSPLLSSPVISSVSPSLRTPNTYSSPQSSTSQLNISQDSPSMRQNSAALKKVKSTKPPFRVTAVNSASAPEALSMRSRRMSESSMVSSVASSPQPALRRSTRLQANKVSSAVKENKTLKKRDDFDTKLNRKLDQLEESMLLKRENVEYMDRHENGAVPKKPVITEVIKKEPVIIRQKRKKEPVLSLPARVVPEPSSEAAVTERDKVTALVMRSYYRFGEVVQALHSYDIQTAMTKLANLGGEQQETAFYWYLKGRLHYEMLQYDKSVSAFAEMRRKDAYFIKGMDYYSVALWHLQKEKDLAVLAKYLIEHHKLAPETYIVYGNVFSLQREHETAIKLFRRALQLNPNYAYALHLLGHEYISLDEMDKASQCFRMAIQADPLHYNGWYGLGLIAFKQEQYASALVSFKKALAVYPLNPIILVNMGVAQHALKQTAEALKTLSSAVNHFPNNPLCRFQKASLLYAMGRLDDAMQELQKLKDLVPKESLVYFLMGKVSKRTDNTHMALMYFSKAMDLDPKGTNNQIKEAFNKLYGGVEDDVVPQRHPTGTTSSSATYASEM